MFISGIDEGLRSYKAIAFISSNPLCLREKQTVYSKLGAYLASTVLSKQKTLEDSLKNLGEELWIN